MAGVPGVAGLAGVPGVAGVPGSSGSSGSSGSFGSSGSSGSPCPSAAPGRRRCRAAWPSSGVRAGPGRRVAPSAARPVRWPAWGVRRAAGPRERPQPSSAAPRGWSAQPGRGSRREVRLRARRSCLRRAAARRGPHRRPFPRARHCAAAVR
ncbi:hypothetical protein SM007_37445 [Streptomyces avermitilis]|nr:hypothetical protein SM007_37445 [Streptomyces avermitilis]